MDEIGHLQRTIAGCQHALQEKLKKLKQGVKEFQESRKKQTEQQRRPH
ncbi:unnamed protein product [marine sediment metagenome]|uniref:Uncharacterized protein n=1 Tax=marine sediment metagenome TaxID=412755 RepID=X1K048_9ZZZZ